MNIPWTVFAFWKLLEDILTEAIMKSLKACPDGLPVLSLANFLTVAGHLYLVYCYVLGGSVYGYSRKLPSQNRFSYFVGTRRLI
jgi:hypothetical protein